MSMIAAPANAMSSTFSAGRSKFVSKLDYFDPDSKDSVLKFIESDYKNYFQASKKLQMNKQVLRLVCEINPHIVDELVGKAKSVAKKILKDDSTSYVASWSCLGYFYTNAKD